MTPPPETQQHMTQQQITLTVNGIDYPMMIDGSRTLLAVIRSDVGLTGTKQGCYDCECGACMVLLDAQPVNSCSYLAAQAEGRQVRTIEGMAAGGSATGGELRPIQRHLLEAGGVHCGFCTPGMIMSTAALLERNPDPSDDEIRIGLSGNLCRCTGYAKIIEAVRSVAVELRL